MRLSGDMAGATYKAPRVLKIYHEYSSRRWWYPAAEGGRDGHIMKNSREKGAAGERELAGVLKGYGYQCRRGQQFCGANGDADVVGLKDIHIECKRVEKLNLDTAMEQATRDARTGEIPAVFHRKNRKEWKVTLRLDDFMKLYAAAERGNESRCQAEF